VQRTQLTRMGLPGAELDIAIAAPPAAVEDDDERAGAPGLGQARRTTERVGQDCVRRRISLALGASGDARRLEDGRRVLVRPRPVGRSLRQPVDLLLSRLVDLGDSGLHGYLLVSDGLSRGTANARTAGHVVQGSGLSRRGGDKESGKQGPDHDADVDQQAPVDSQMKSSHARRLCFDERRSLRPS